MSFADAALPCATAAAATASQRSCAACALALSGIAALSQLILAGAPCSQFSGVSVQQYCCMPCSAGKVDALTVSKYGV
jgi:hypothetical protein